ncbi:hypothetical protein SDC9_187196 [bioreactor metagenome]|uniref:Uncharacterized protein n=1 Tax=bioreactor metagenome TaxID=1076179 RepID=A0A645HKZ4_9ZZZZ
MYPKIAPKEVTRDILLSSIKSTTTKNATPKGADLLISMVLLIKIDITKKVIPFAKILL